MTVETGKIPEFRIGAARQEDKANDESNSQKLHQGDQQAGVAPSNTEEIK